MNKCVCICACVYVKYSESRFHWRGYQLLWATTRGRKKAKHNNKLNDMMTSKHKEKINYKSCSCKLLPSHVGNLPIWIVSEGPNFGKIFKWFLFKFSQYTTVRYFMMPLLTKVKKTKIVLFEINVFFTIVFFL